MGLPAVGRAFLCQTMLNTLPTEIPTGQPDPQSSAVSLSRLFQVVPSWQLKRTIRGRRLLTLKPEHPGTTTKCSCILWELPSDFFPKISTSIISRKGKPHVWGYRQTISPGMQMFTASRVSLNPSPLDWKGWLLKAGCLLRNWKGAPWLKSRVKFPQTFHMLTPPPQLISATCPHLNFAHRESWVVVTRLVLNQQSLFTEGSLWPKLFRMTQDH